MKKLILLLLFIPLVSFGQDITNLSLERTPIYQKKTEGVFYFKEGIFYAVSVANSGFTSIKKMTRQAEEQMENFAKNNAIEELKKLKELLDLDLITKEEFDKKSKELKKIILDN